MFIQMAFKNILSIYFLNVSVWQFDPETDIKPQSYKGSYFKLF